MTFTELKEKALSLPMLPGVYIMMDKSGEVIYVGKAKRLKNRVTSYFRESGHNAKTAAMVAKIFNFDYIIANSEFDALITENSLIKLHKPKYNILLKDDKGYPFVRIDLSEPYPKFKVVPKRGKDGAKYLGPFSSRSTVFSAIDSIFKALKLPTCGKRFPVTARSRPCLNFHMGQCAGYCRGKPGEAEYRAGIAQAIMILEGKSEELCADIERQMLQAAEEMKFELAAELRDRYRSLHALTVKQIAVSGSAADTDAVGLYRGAARSCFVVMHYIKGQLLGSDNELIETPMEDDAEALSSLLRQYYTVRGTYPKVILLPVETGDEAELEQLFSEAACRAVKLRIPQKGYGRKLVSVASVNAVEHCERATNQEERVSKTLEWLQKALGMDRLPARIEACDISNFGGEGIVGALTVFDREKPVKKDYRHYKMKTLTEQDDYRSMQELLTRRFTRMVDEREGIQKPDLLLVDGGQAHAAIAQQLVQDFGLDIAVFGMVKDDRHRTRALISADGREIGISTMPNVFAFIGRIQEETHRFAIEYQRKQRKSVHSSSLDKIEGVGPTRRNALLKQFKSIAAIREASEETLCLVVPKHVARAVYEYYHGGENK